MTHSITEEMRFRQRLCEYAKKYGVTKAARKYQTNRQFTYRQLSRYDGTVQSLAPAVEASAQQSQRSHRKRTGLIKRMLKRNGIYGYAEVYVRCRERGYTRSFGSMCRQIRKNGYRRPRIRRKSYARYERLDGKYPGDKVQIDLKYCPERVHQIPMLWIQILPDNGDRRVQQETGSFGREGKEHL
jgi:hypothetical protein